ncbi:MAG TPA: ATP-binding protein [Prolixibacteraceae bacterium]|jgi:anti-sigma regulatory factor (Ser/Thr protein kinase)|nr:anti-sigma regulatory factor [Bacteroidales bacterium]HNZ71567.1 ATP-binding protein [Prolixibacteraceae bacterium]HPB05335.1 ATP-binding protein [Prolixibacteraceae bacterium]HQN93140.1 ATP-binding protein [Prolixibacteraceae bacterium]
MVKLKYDIEGGNFNRAGNASSQVKRVLKQLNIDQRLIKKIVVALYEAEVNIVAHAYEGTMEINISPEKIDMILQDKGPGISNVEQAMQEGFSTASQKVREMGFGAGMGLPNIKKNTDLMEIETSVGVGTTLRMTKYLNNVE